MPTDRVGGPQPEPGAEAKTKTQLRRELLLESRRDGSGGLSGTASRCKKR
ncbi:MAG: hypothetical protein ACXQTZ_05245 [Candidatus Alkanophagales archaeon]